MFPSESLAAYYQRHYLGQPATRKFTAYRVATDDAPSLFPPARRDFSALGRRGGTILRCPPGRNQVVCSAAAQLLGALRLGAHHGPRAGRGVPVHGGLSYAPVQNGRAGPRSFTSVACPSCFPAPKRRRACGSCSSKSCVSYGPTTCTSRRCCAATCT